MIFLSKKIFCLEKILCSENVVSKNIGPKMLVQKILCPKKLWVKKIVFPKRFGFKKILGPKQMLVQNIFWFEKVLGPSKFYPKRCWFKTSCVQSYFVPLITIEWAFQSASFFCLISYINI